MDIDLGELLSAGIELVQDIFGNNYDMGNTEYYAEQNDGKSGLD